MSTETKKFEKPETILRFRSGRTLPRGELWLGTELLADAGFSDTPESHLRLADQLAHDLVCFPVALETRHKPDLGYRFFPYDELQSATRFASQKVAAVVDGPFQELVNRKGLIKVLTDWYRQPAALLDAYDRERSRVLELIQRCLEQGVDIVVIADDLAENQGAFLRPKDLESLCGDFYTRAVQLVHTAQVRAFWHCCGKITSLIPLIKNWRFDGLAAIQHSAGNLIFLSSALGPEVSILGGIENGLLDSDPPTPEAVDAFKNIVLNACAFGMFDTWQQLRTVPGEISVACQKNLSVG